MAGLRTPGEPPAIWVGEISLIAGPPFSTQAQTCDDFLRPGACPSRPWPSQGRVNSCLLQDIDGMPAASSALALVARSTANRRHATAPFSFSTAGQGA
jgi:hypothetical protein